MPFVLALVLLLSACGGQTTQGESKPAMDTQTQVSEPAVNQQQSGIDFEIGLRNVKIDTEGTSLTDAQKQVLQFFDTDYLSVYDYEFFRRYPNIFIGTQMTNMGRVYKVLQQDNDSYEALMGWNYTDAYLAQDWDYFKSQLVLLRGTTGDAWLMDNDFVNISGRYTGIENINVDGTSYTVPVFEVHSCTVWSGDDGDYSGLARFSYKDIKSIAKAIWGDNIRVSESTEDEVLTTFVDFPQYPVYTITLENQSNANFSKYLMVADGGKIYDISARTSWEDPVQRYLEFAPDFQHYFLYTYDSSLENLELAYYDTSFNKLWSREFEDTTSAIYDYTKSNIYLVANNSLYVMDLQTGEDATSPQFVGQKLDIRKLTDGILLLGQEKSDGLMKCDLSGKVEWSVNLPYDNVYPLADLQVIDGNLVLGYTYQTGKTDEYGWDELASIYCLYDLSTGDLIQSGETVAQ